MKTPTQYFACSFYSFGASGCSNRAVMLIFEVAATVKIWTNSEHFWNPTDIHDSRTYFETPIISWHFFANHRSKLTLIFKPLELGPSLRARWNRKIQTLRMNVIPTSYLQLFSSEVIITGALSLQNGYYENRILATLAHAIALYWYTVTL